MASTLESITRPEPLQLVASDIDAMRGSEATLLLEAFAMFTQASTSLESAFEQLQARARRLSDELEAKNRELEQSLLEKEEIERFLNTVLESLPCGVLVLDEGNNLTLCNPVAVDLLEEQENSARNSGRKRRKLQNATLRNYFSSAVATQGDTKEVEIPLATKNRMKFLATSSTPLTDILGKRGGTLHIIRDVTEMKALEEQNKRGMRLSAMGEMAVELAHEIRNPLGSIELFASLLEKELPAEGDPGRWAANIRIGSRSLNNIVSNMLQFANPVSPTFSEVDLHNVIDEILGFTDAITRQRGVGVEKHLGAVSSRVSGDRELLKQMILNLILNSLQAMPSCGSLKIETRDVRQLPGGVRCRGLELRVQDSGLGIPPENLSRIFDPFFTTNKNGTGLGLSVVHQIVDRHSGFIQVQSKVNSGTTFTIVLPSGSLPSGRL